MPPKQKPDLLPNSLPGQGRGSEPDLVPDSLPPDNEDLPPPGRRAPASGIEQPPGKDLDR
jgi:hypothetical protein